MTIPTLPNPVEWGLSAQTVLLLSKEPDILLDLAQARLLPPLPPGYVPNIVEVLFDDILYICSQQGIITYLRNCNPDYEPNFVEYRFDGEIALFQVGSECVVNRIEGIARVAVLQDLLHQGGMSNGTHN
ncbi:MAG: hypothetical protein ACFB8W_16530 [Elainellaceae cyanobacterium]